MVNRLKTVSLALTLALMSSAVIAQQAATPLLQEGKKTLYQRVLTTPSCQLMAVAGDTKGQPQEAFSRYYVYQRQMVNKHEWLQVGPDSFGKTSGWLDSVCTVPWKMQMSLVFTNPAGRDRLLFFKDKASLEQVIDADNPAQAVTEIRQSLAQSGQSPSILAQEPAEFIDFKKNFYLLPILHGEETMNSKGFYQRVLEVASVSKRDPVLAQTSTASTPKTEDNAQDPNKATELTGFRAAIVFVIDSSISMDPYINRTREAIKQVYQDIEKERLGDRVKFGLIAFRSNTKAVPGLEFTAKLFVDPSTVKDGADFFDKAKALKQASVSSKEFDEDSYAGINEALNSVRWNEFGGRYIVLITDAGALDGNNPLSATGLNSQQLRLEAQHRGVAIYTLHLLTKAGVKNHDQAKAQYNDLSFNNYLNKALYYPVNAGDVNEFGAKVALLSKAISSQVKNAYLGEMAAGSPLTATPAKEEKKNEEASMQDDAALLGRAMQLAYLGDKKNTQAPPVFNAWVSDRDFIKDSMPTAEARVLLTKAQLSDLSDVVKKIANAANSGLISPDDMFSQLRSVAAAMGQDPNQLKQDSSTKIADLGLLGEYLDDLPYKSQVASIDEATWKSMSGLQQEKFIRELHGKLRYYQVFNADVDRWIPLTKDADPRDNVYPVPLEALP